MQQMQESQVDLVLAVLAHVQASVSEVRLSNYSLSWY